jgi:chaperone modulatory protein CbpM
MNSNNIIIGVLVDETSTCSFSEVCQRFDISEELLIEIIEQGLFPHQSTPIEQIALDQKSLRKIESAIRLHKDLGINFPGVALAIELLEQIEQMRNELSILRKHF